MTVGFRLFFARSFEKWSYMMLRVCTVSAAETSLKARDGSSPVEL